MAEDALEKVPTGQARQLGAPGVSMYQPATHEEQVVGGASADEVEKLPAKPEKEERGKR